MAALVTADQIRDNIARTVRDNQIDSLIFSFMNLTGMEIHSFHTWTWLRRKQTFSTVTNQEDYNIDSEVDRIGFLRQLTTPQKLFYIPDELFYRFLPNPEDKSTGTPRFYRLWAETGFSAQLAADDTVYVVSSNSADGASFNVRIRGRNASGEPISESLTLNGTSNVTSSTTFEAGGLFSISKSAATTGTISCRRTTGDTLLAEMEPDNLAPRYKRLSLYPVPSAAITMHLEYYERYLFLVNDTDVPQMDSQNNWVLREGALAKTWEYKQNEVAAAQHQAIFDRALLMMRRQDDSNRDYIPVIQPRFQHRGVVRRTADSINDNFPAYSLSP